MPAFVAGQPFFLARAGGRCLFSSSLPLPRFLLSATVPGKLPLCSFSPLFSRGGHGTATAISAAGKKYIEEDYVVKKVTAKEVEELVKGERSIPIVLDFYATWCGPCILMAQALEMLAVEYENNVLFIKVDTDDEYEFARDMQVRGLPTLYFISPNPKKDAIRAEGLIPPEMIKSIIDNDL